MEKGISRREFNASLARYGMGLAGVLYGLSSCSVSMHPKHPGNPLIDLPLLDKIATNYTNRKSPPLSISPSTRTPADFLQHYYRNPPWGSAGIDYQHVSESSEIVPIGKGVVTGVGKEDMSGNVIHIHHGAGFFSFYSHLEEIFVKPKDSVNRNTVIGIMGNTGYGAQGIVHLHLGVRGPTYTKWLKLNHVQYYPKEHFFFHAYPYYIDPEELSILGRHMPLPYSLPEDALLDVKFDAKVRKNREQVDEFLKLFPHMQKYRFSPRENVIILEYRLFNLTDMALDRDVTDLYKEATKENPSIPKQSAEKIKKSLEEIMADTIPRFTAPIKEPKF